MERKYTKEQIANIASDILQAYSDNTYPVKMIELAQNIGLQVFKASFDREDVSGLIEAENRAIYVSKKEGISRQRFSIAHEIGHYVLHYKGGVFEEKDKQRHISFRDNVSTLGFSVREMEANFFAANLLMPKEKVEELYREGRSANYMADFFFVSDTAIRHRLDFLGL